MIDYVDTFTPVARLVSIRAFFAEYNELGHLASQGDAPTAFVKANLRGLIHVKQPRGFEEGEACQIWLLRKALYRLKQAGRKWYIELDKTPLAFANGLCRPSEIPMDQSAILYPGEGKDTFATKGPYKQAVGAFL
eukprot:jgi/Phyca11/133384/e_gw1.436.2.1